MIRGWLLARIGLLTRNHSFAAFFLAQMISPLGDRLNQVALTVMVFNRSGSASLAALVFAASFLPQTLFGPLAGIYVDRFDRRTVMITSDLLRAGLVLLLPLSVFVNPIFALPLVFVVNTVTLFFRPASFTIVPRLVPAEDLMAANSATSTAATLADLAGYPIAGIITVLLAPIIAIAFVLDSASFFASAALCLALPSDRPEAAAHESLRTDFLVGWQALRRDAALLEGAILTAAIWLPTGIMLPLLVTYAAQDLLDGPIGYPASYSALLLSLALGFLAGAVLVSYLCRRIRRGLVILAGYGLYVPQIMILVLSHNSLVAVGAVFFGGLGNALWLVAIQTIYMERTPRAVLGRVVAFRQTLVWGAMSLSSVAAAMIVTAVSVPLAFTASAILTSAILLVAWTRPAMRDPDGVPLPAD